MKHTIVLLILVCIPSIPEARPAGTGPAPPSMNLMWYRQPATAWTEALPIGNGRLGAMVFGGTESERIQLNEETIWAGEKRDRNNPDGANNLSEVRRLLFEGRPREAEQLAERTIISTPKRLPPYQPLGDLLIRFSGQREPKEYRRELDLDSGIVRINYRSGDALFSREVFSSSPDQVIVIRLTSDKPGRVSFAATLTREQDSKTRALSPNRVVIEGEAIARGRERPHGMEPRLDHKLLGAIGRGRPGS